MSTIAPDRLYQVGFIDPAGSKNIHLKKQRSSQAIIILGSDGLHTFVLEAWKDRVKTDKLVEQIFSYAERYPNLKRFGCEDNAMQELFASTTIMLAKDRGVRIPIEGVTQPTRVEKTMRIRMQLQPLLAYGRLFIREDMDELRQAIITFPQCPLNYLDLVDALASAVKLLPGRSIQKDRDQTLSGLAQYLSKAGVSPEVARQRMAAFGQQQRRGGEAWGRGR